MCSSDLFPSHDRTDRKQRKIRYRKQRNRKQRKQRKQRNTENLTITINGTEVNPNIIPSNEGRINNTGIITISPNTIKQNEIQIKVSKNSPMQLK